MSSIFVFMATIANPSSVSVAVTLAVISLTSLGAVLLNKFNK